MINQFQFQVGSQKVWVAWNADERLTQLELLHPINLFADEQDPDRRDEARLPAFVREWIERLRAYFEEGQPLGPVGWEKIEQSGWTEFQRQVYISATLIPHGETRTYQWIASRIRNPSASRAVGQALRLNPLPVIIPCHRVVAAKSLGGFMGSTDPSQPKMRLKCRLMALEEEYRNPVLPFLMPIGQLFAEAAFS